MLLRLDISLLCKIFNFLDLESLLKLSLVNKLFYNLSQKNINSKINVKKLEFYNEAIYHWKDFIFIDAYGPSIYNDYEKIDNKDKIELFNDIIQSDVEKKIKGIIYDIIQINFKKFYRFVDPKLFTYLLREWYDNERFSDHGTFKDLILTYRNYTDINNSTVEQIRKLNEYYKIITRNIPNNDMIYLLDNF